MRPPILLFGLLLMAITFHVQTSQLVYADAEKSISVELNKLEKKKQNCLLTFVVSNHFETTLNELAYEVVLFDKQQKVDLMTVFDFQKIENGKTRVRQFQIPEKDCKSISKLLINDVSKCQGSKLAPDACSKNLKILNKTPIEFLN